MKTILLVCLSIFILSCGTGDHISTVRVPPSIAKEDSLTTPNKPIEEETAVVADSANSVTGNQEIKEPITEDAEANVSKPNVEPSPTPATPIKTEESKTGISSKPGNVPSTPIAPPIKEPSVVPKKKVNEKKAFDYRNFNRDSHRTGEKLTFDINYLAITAGEATMSVPEEFIYNGRVVQKILFEARSSRSYSWIYKVQDRYESLLDKYGIYPWKFNKEINEGSFHTKEEVVFDHIKEVAIEDGNEVKIPPYTHDIISAFYYVRNQDLANMKPGDVFKLSNYSSGKIHPLDVRFVGWEKITVPAGVFNCVVLEPLVKAGGLFKDEGTLFVWLTNDQLKIPVKVATKVVIGSINVELTKIEGVNRPIPAKIK